MRIPAVRTFGIQALCLGDQLVEHRVVEVSPPLLGLRVAAAALFSGQRLERAARPAGQPGDLGTLEVRPDRGAAGEEQGSSDGEQAPAPPARPCGTGSGGDGR
jgi:hypothetical protein